MIKSLPSEYAGVTFRSRLEARWAALFDHYELLWVYEPDAFNTPGGRYLPDFLLPELGAFVEIKPEPLAFNAAAVESVVRQTGKEFLILDSPVVRCRSYAFMFADSVGVEIIPNWGNMVWCLSEKYIGPKPHDKKRRWYWDDIPGYAYENAGASTDCPHCHGLRFEPEHFTRIRSLRFENGRAAI